MFLLKKWQSLSLFTRIMVGFVLGIIAGFVMKGDAAMFAFLGTILTRLLTMVVAPLVLGLLICAAADVKDFKKAAKAKGVDSALKPGTYQLVTLMATDAFFPGSSR